MVLASSKIFWRKWACREKNLKSSSRLPVLPKIVLSSQSRMSKLSQGFARINTDQFLLLVPMVKIERSQKGYSQSREDLRSRYIVACPGKLATGNPELTTAFTPPARPPAPVLAFRCR